MAVVLVVAAIVLLAVSAVLGPAAVSPWARAVYLIAQWCGPLLLLAAVVRLFRQRIYSWLTARLVDLAGPALITAMPPRAALNAVLARVFGEKVGHPEITTALLGGGGRDPGARDTAVSKGTTVQVRFERIDDLSCLTELAWSHEFSGVRNNHLLVMFATSDVAIFTRINSERVYPLFEAWLLENDEQLDNFVPALKDRLDVGVSYRATDGSVHVVKPRPGLGEEVALRDFGQYIRLPNSVDRKNLRVFSLDLYDLSHPDHVVDAIESLALRASTVSSFDQGFTTWSAPHPCFVKKIVFDVRQHARMHEKLVYQIVAATLTTSSVPSRGTWTHVPDEIEVVVDAWMLPGHAVTLLWRPIYGPEPRDDLGRW